VPQAAGLGVAVGGVQVGKEAVCGCGGGGGGVLLSGRSETSGSLD